MKKILLATIVLFSLSTISYAQDVDHPDNVTIQGNLGVGLSGPLSHKLEVGGDINTTGSYRIGGAKVLFTLSNSLILGPSAGNTTMTGDYNLFLGRHAGGLNSTGENNTFIGQSAGQVNATGKNNTFIGFQAGQFLSGNGNGNTFIGTSSGRSGSGADGSNNTFIGFQTGFNNTSGSKNIFIGYQTGQNNTTASDNISIGYKAGLTHTSNDGNIFIGTTAGEGNSSGLNNVMLGKSAGKTNNGEGNVFLGYQAGYSESGNNKLYIANSYNADPLLYGQFDNKKVGININPSTIDANSPTLTVGGEVKVLGNIDASGFLINGQPISTSTTTLWTESNDVATYSKKVVIGDASITTPGEYKLYVAGGILSRKVKVAVPTTNDWRDFVFEKDYDLRSLSEVESFIKENKHLPEIPSAKEVVKEGLDLGEMDAKLLQKIEELTLYMIDMKKENELIKKQNQQLIERVTQLENK